MREEHGFGDYRAACSEVCGLTTERTIQELRETFLKVKGENRENVTAKEGRNHLCLGTGRVSEIFRN